MKVTWSQNGQGQGMRTSASCGAFKHGTPGLVEPYLPGPQSKLAVDWIIEYMCCGYWGSSVWGPQALTPLHHGLWAAQVSTCPTTLLLGQLFPLSGAHVGSFCVHQLWPVKNKTFKSLKKIKEWGKSPERTNNEIHLSSLPHAQKGGNKNAEEIKKGYH